MRFPKERVLFAVDFIPVRALAFRDLPDAYMPDWIDSLKLVEQMDFDILAPGHGQLGRKEHVRMFQNYFELLYTNVLQYTRDGKSLEEMKRLIVLNQYSDWSGYDQSLELNIEGMYRLIQANRRGNS
jgi:glyoxylase-like metal-dependent hydrolase (beta-lactamase superfamily II)